MEKECSGALPVRISEIENHQGRARPLEGNEFFRRWCRSVVWESFSGLSVVERSVRSNSSVCLQAYKKVYKNSFVRPLGVCCWTVSGTFVVSKAQKIGKAEYFLGLSLLGKILFYFWSGFFT